MTPAGRFRRGVWLAALLAAALPRPAVADPPAPKTRPTPYARWARGPGNDPNYFPIAVWLQSPANAPKFQAAGFNLYVGLWKGPTEAQLAELTKAGMPVICDQNAVGLKHAADPIIVGWMHGDESDNAQALKDRKGYGPPIPPETVVADYKKIQAADPSRPILLNLGQGVAWDGWIGRGVRTNHPEDYPRYVQGCDIASFDIYPAVSQRKEVAGKLWYVAHGVDRLVKWTEGRKVVWDCIECTRIANPNVKPTPHQVRAEVWMSLIHGSMGLVYFVHQFQPRFIEPALLHDEEMLAAVTKINAQIRALAPVLNLPAAEGIVEVKSSSPDVPIDVLVKRDGRTTFLFAVCMRDQPATASFTVQGLPKEVTLDVLGEKRKILVRGGAFQDAFEPYDVHLYRIAAPSE